MSTQSDTPRIEDLRGLSFFEDLDDDQLTALIALAHLEQAPQGAVLFNEGEPADALRVMRTGRVDLTMCMPGHPHTVVSTVSRGEVVDLSAFLPDGEWATSARAVKPCEMIVLPASALASLAPPLGVALLRSALRLMQRRLQDARLQFLDIFGEP